MPNGNPEFHLRDEPELEVFFRPIADVLAGFAAQPHLGKVLPRSALMDFLKKLKGEPKLLDPRMLSGELEISLKLILSWRFGCLGRALQRLRLLEEHLDEAAI